MDKIILKNIETTISINTYENDLELASKIIGVFNNINSIGEVTLNNLDTFISNNTLLFEKYLLEKVKNKPYNELVKKLKNAYYVGRFEKKLDEILIVSEPLLRYYSNYIIKNNPDNFLLSSKLLNQLQIASNSANISVDNSYTEFIYK
jgi:hypothetical protein